LGSWEVSPPEVWRIKARPPPMREKPAQVHETTLIDLPAMEAHPRKMGSHQQFNQYHDQSHVAPFAAIHNRFWQEPDTTNPLNWRVRGYYSKFHTSSVAYIGHHRS